MWIERDMAPQLLQNQQYVQLLIGPRQCGKSSLLSEIGQERYSEVTFDDFQQRDLAEQDPALFLAQYTLPLNIDEVQYAPNIFPEIKKIVDHLKRLALKNTVSSTPLPLFRLTGSNQILMDKYVKETLVGRAAYYYLHTLSVNEIVRAFPTIALSTLLFKGGWPELYTQPIDPVHYLNDYIRQYLEKDIVLAAGINKQQDFHLVLKMLAARTGQLLNYSDIAKDTGVRSNTIKEWVSILERTGLLKLLPAYHSNLNNRLIKMPKLFFLDTGLAIRLQGWNLEAPVLLSSQAGGLFESLVYGEIIKFIHNFGKTWSVYLWRTKEAEEIDFIIEINPDTYIALESKLAIQNVRPINLSPAFKKTFPKIKNIDIVTAGGELKQLAPHCKQIPITQLTSYLQDLTTPT
ncbi:MAG: ATP-binding protein [Legionellales bacterium]|jgi:hypothetical protein